MKALVKPISFLRYNQAVIMTDFLFILRWWFVLFALGVIFLPLSSRVVPFLKDSGWAISKIFGLGLFGLIIWLLGSLKILPFDNLTVWLTLSFLITLNLFLLQRKRKELLLKIKTSLKLIALEELLFFSALLFWATIRGFNPEIHGLEKYMDFGFVNAILKTQFFPPQDMWLAGETINYYYFGHLVTAILIKLSQIKIIIAYNLMIATLFALTIILGFNFGFHLVGLTKTKLKIPLALLTALLLGLGGNLHPLYHALKTGSLKTYWYPDATRFIVQKFGALDNTIHEFPVYSFVVADLHGHLINLPFVLFFLLFLLNLLIKFKIKKKICLSYLEKATLGLLLAIFYLTNTWDFAIYGLVLVSVFFFFNLNQTKSLSKTIINLLIQLLPSVALGLLLTIPFQLSFTNIAAGIKFVDYRSPPWMLLVLWGLPLFLSLSLAFVLFKKKKLNEIDFFLISLLIPAWFFILLPEVIYVKDIYIESYQRANTVFKFTYQSFVIFSLITPLLIVRIGQNLKKPAVKKIFLAVNLVLLFFVFTYPYLAIKDFYGLKNYQGLQGDNYLAKHYPQDLKLIEFLNQTQSEKRTIVEAVGESYTDYGRVSAFTGLPTILGWRVHEWLWRGSFDEPAKRTTQVENIYQSHSLEETKKLLNQYQVKYIVVGKLERQKYPTLNEEKFNQLGKIVFEENQTKLYQID